MKQEICPPFFQKSVWGASLAVGKGAGASGARCSFFWGIGQGTQAHEQTAVASLFLQKKMFIFSDEIRTLGGSRTNCNCFIIAAEKHAHFCLKK